MPRLLPALHRDTATPHRHPLVFRPFARLPREATHDNAVAFDEPAASLKIPKHQAFSRAFDTKHPCAPLPENRLTHRKRDGARGLRILLQGVATPARLPWQPSAHQKSFLQATSPLAVRIPITSKAPQPSTRPTKQIPFRRLVCVRVSGLHRRSGNSAAT